MSEKLTLLQRINAVQREVDYVQKEKKQGMRYSIVSHDAVTAKVRPLMVKHGVVYFPCFMDLSQVGNRTQVTMTVRFASIDDASDIMDVMTAGYGIDDQDKGPGKAISYAVKYALLKALGLESGDDPDQDQDVTHRYGSTDHYEGYAPPPLRKSGLPEKGWRKDGSRTSFWLRNNFNSDELRQQLRDDAADCSTMVSFEKLKEFYRGKAREMKFNESYKIALKDEFDAIEQRILDSLDNAQLAELPLKDTLQKSLKRPPAEDDAAMLDQRMKDERAAMANHPLNAG